MSPQLIKDVGTIVEPLYKDITPSDEDCKGSITYVLLSNELNHSPRSDLECREAFRC